MSVEEQEDKIQGAFPLEQDSNEAETVCRDCAFAVYDGDTQTACSLGRLDKFEENGAEVVEVYDETNKEFFVIKGRVCVCWRHPDWQEKHEGRNLEEIVKKETTIRMDAVVYIDKDSAYEDVKNTLDSLKAGQVKPACVTFVKNQCEVDDWAIVTLGRKSGLKWKAETIREDDATRGRCVDIAIRKTSAKDCNYYFVYNAGEIVPKNFISDINHSINEDMNRFLAPRSDDGNGDVGQIHIHKQIGGNRNKPFLAKIENTSRSQGCPELLQKTSDIVSE